MNKKTVNQKSQLTRFSVANKLIGQLNFSGKNKRQQAYKLLNKVTSDFQRIGLCQKEALLILNSKLFYVDYYSLLHRGYNETTSFYILDILAKNKCIIETEKDSFFLNYLLTFPIPSELMVHIKNDAKDRRLNYKSFDIYRMINYMDWSNRFERNYYIFSTLNDLEKFDIIETFKQVYGVEKPVFNEI